MSLLNGFCVFCHDEATFVVEHVGVLNTDLHFTPRTSGSSWGHLKAFSLSPGWRPGSGPRGGVHSGAGGLNTHQIHRRENRWHHLIEFIEGC